MKQLKGRVAVVTGGASGIGLGLARRLLEEGMKVVVADLHQHEIDKVVGELAPLGEIIGHRTDVSKRADVEALAQATMDRFGAVHLLCNNAGVGGLQRFETTPIETWEWIVGVNLWGVVYGCKIFLPLLKQQPEAHILNTASMAAFMYGPYVHPYSAAKAGVVALTEGLAREFEADGYSIGLSVLCPGPVNTAIANDERNAPEGYLRREEADPELHVIRDRVNKGMEHGTDPVEVAGLCVDAIRNDQLYVFTHPEWNHLITRRAEHIVNNRPGPALMSIR